MLHRPAMTIALLAAFCGAAVAQGRPDARAMSCDQVQATIQSRGAVVLTTGRHTYDRYVAGGHYCSVGEVAMPQTIRTRDGESCVVYACRIDPFEPFWD
ncbi:MAG: hypothetical protein DCC69_06220 [Hyphomicrobiales bacterium]|nr:MAG: hypothetical protein DCC69_06220 [Hyphomicrobiales bacterium]